MLMVAAQHEGHPIKQIGWSALLADDRAECERAFAANESFDPMMVEASLMHHGHVAHDHDLSVFDNDVSTLSPDPHEDEGTGAPVLDLNTAGDTPLPPAPDATTVDVVDDAVVGDITNTN